MCNDGLVVVVCVLSPPVWGAVRYLITLTCPCFSERLFAVFQASCAARYSLVLILVCVVVVYDYISSLFVVACLSYDP